MDSYTGKFMNFGLSTVLFLISKVTYNSLAVPSSIEGMIASARRA